MKKINKLLIIDIFLIIIFVISITQKDIFNMIKNYLNLVNNSNFQDLISMLCNLLILLIGIVLSISTVLLSIENKAIINILSELGQKKIVYKSSKRAIKLLVIALILSVLIFIFTSIPWYIKSLILFLIFNLCMIAIYRLNILYRILDSALKETFKDQPPKSNFKKR